MEQTVVLISDVSEEGEHYMPLSTLAVATAVKRHGYRPVVLDAHVQADWRELLVANLEGAALLGLSSFTGPSITCVLEASELARRAAPDVPQVWGGYHATQAYASILDEGIVNYVVRGPGEEAVVGLLDALERADDVRRSMLEQVPNLAYLHGGRVVATPMRQLIAPEAQMAIDYSLIDSAPYFADGDRRVPYISSYGCPHACTFCAEPEQSGRRWRGLPAERVVDDLQDIERRFAPDRIDFFDPNFSTSASRVQAIVEEMEARGASIPIFCDMRTRDVVQLAARFDLARLPAVGIGTIFMGVESGSDAVLRRIRKGANSAQAWEAAKLLDDAGIEFVTSFIHDFPDETSEESEETLALAESLCGLTNNRQSHHFFTPYPLTQAYDELVASGEIQEQPRTQRQWADTSTFWASGVWAGRPAFRRTVLRRLLALQRDHPHAITARGLPMPPGVKASSEGRDTGK